MQAVAVGLIFLSVSVLHDAQLLSDAPTTVPELEPGRDLRVHCSGVRKSTCRPEQFGWSGVQYACRTPLHKRAFRAIYMTKRLWVAGLLFAMSTLAPLAATRDAAWRAVDEAIQKGLPRTAITNLDLIIPAALQDKAYGEATKAIARKIVLEGNVQGNKAEEKITRMEAEIAKAPRELKPLLQTVLATWYWHYFQNNRWRFLRRTATAAP